MLHHVQMLRLLCWILSEGRTECQLNLNYGKKNRLGNELLTSLTPTPNVTPIIVDTHHDALYVNGINLNCIIILFLLDLTHHTMNNILLKKKRKKNQMQFLVRNVCIHHLCSKQVTSHYLNQWCPNLLMACGITSPQQIRKKTHVLE